MQTSDSSGADTAATQGNEWPLRYCVGDLVHYTEWTSEFAVVENLYDQYRRGEYGHDVVNSVL